MSSILIRRANMVSGGNSPRLPAEFTELAYLIGTGTQFILTNYYPNDKSVVSTKMYFSGKNTFLFGVRWTNSPTYDTFGINWNSANKIMAYYGRYSDNKYISSASAYSLDTLYDIEFGLTAMTIDNQSISIVRSEFTSTVKLSLGALGSSSRIIGRLYPIVITEDGVTVAEYIPAKRNTDDAIGMYDLVSNTFLTNAGSGTFNYGTL